MLEQSWQNWALAECLRSEVFFLRAAPSLRSVLVLYTSESLIWRPGNRLIFHFSPRSQHLVLFFQTSVLIIISLSAFCYLSRNYFFFKKDFFLMGFNSTFSFFFLHNVNLQSCSCHPKSKFFFNSLLAFKTSVYLGNKVIFLNIDTKTCDSSVFLSRETQWATFNACCILSFLFSTLNL